MKGWRDGGMPLCIHITFDHVFRVRGSPGVPPRAAQPRGPRSSPLDTPLCSARHRYYPPHMCQEARGRKARAWTQKPRRGET
eukprot:483922-Prorocentrum_minimum.AAC.1